ncbi:EF-hand domain-containing protein [Raineya orbicola]|jgi:Ca2+-binding EF-hand superfamily protein|uniref:EF-hand domain pair n=1 Tax=Raineya orbicola TaxID=2016530 RepID=A0A2N3II64_9BACT|nr:EF-hand domain-containing protein [Raineya orbicola]PKQ70029.1 EF-hand domain pair [Raineya orbicola]
MLSDFQKQKITKMFCFFDADGNKVIEPEDMDIIAEEFRKSFGWQVGSEDDKKFKGALKKYWRRLTLGNEEAQDEPITLEVFLKAYERNLQNQQTYEEYVKPFLDHIYPAIDTNKDDMLQPSEFNHLYIGFRNSLQEAQAAFQKLDLNGDGVLSREEVYQHFYDFHFSQDANAPGNFFFGSL